MKIQMKMAFLQNTNISAKKGVEKKCLNGMEQMTQRSCVQTLGRKCLSGSEIRL